MMGSQQRSRRQTATRLFAREFYESSLPDGGQGEYDPRFIVTKLGARNSIRRDSKFRWMQRILVGSQGGR